MLSYKDAVETRRNNPSRNFCSYGADKKPVADPYSARDRFLAGTPFVCHSSPKFSISPGATVYTIGSCFARNVESSLQKAGFELPVFSEDIDQSIYVSKPFWPHTVLNKYNAHAMALEIERYVGRQVLPDDGIICLGEDKWFDPQMSYTKLAPEKLVRDTRAKLDRIGAALKRSDVLVLTLGLTETWLDSDYGYVFNNNIAAVAKHRVNSLKVFNARPDQVYDVLGKALEALHEVAPDLKVVITVSPVPMTQTFLDQDVAAANTYSKGTLRAAAQMLYEDLPFVDYFPSYEMVVCSPRALAWQDDQIHVTSTVINPIISEFSKRYLTT